MWFLFLVIIYNLDINQSAESWQRFIHILQSEILIVWTTNYFKYVPNNNIIEQYNIKRMCTNSKFSIDKIPRNKKSDRKYNR